MTQLSPHRHMNEPSVTLLWAVFACFLAFGLWAHITMIDEVTRGEGRIVPSQHVQVIQNLEGGIVDTFFTSEGEQVQAGQLLVKLRNVGVRSDVQSSRERIYGLQAAITRLQAEAAQEELVFSKELQEHAAQAIQKERDVFTANQQQLRKRHDVLAKQIQQKTHEYDSLQEKIRNMRNVVRLSREERNMIAPVVARGSAGRIELLRLERELALRETELQDLLKQGPIMQTQIEELTLKREQIDAEFLVKTRQELVMKNNDMRILEESIEKFQDRELRTDIRTPVAGIVKTLHVTTIGGVVAPGADIAEIVPFDDTLMIDTMIRPSDIAFLHPGQKAIIKLTAYDFSIYGALSGQVVGISADSIQNERGDYFYRVKIRADQPYLMHHGKKLTVIPGMVAQVDILTGKKSILDFILKPITKTLNNAMKER